MSEAKNYKDTVLLPKTGFPMKADLVTREPQRLAQWEQQGLYQRIMEKSAGRPKFVLHDGPPFANGDVHMGTALNKVLKDIIIKSKTMAGYHAPYIPGWDCHGLPIEFKVVKEAKDLAPAEVRTRSEAYARKFIDIQRQSFKRLGVFGDWENPYLTLAPAYEADIMRTFAKFVEKGLVYRAKRPVLWSYGAQTALAEAEVEYKEKTSPAIYVKFALPDGNNLVIWTTTPWTLPANLGIALHPDFNYTSGTFTHADGRSESLIIADSRIEAFQADTGFTLDAAQPTTKFKGKDLNGSEAQHPFLPRTSKIINALFVTDDTGTGAVHMAPGHGTDDYNAGREHGLDILSPVDDAGCYTAECGLPDFVGRHVFKSNEGIIEILQNAGALLGRSDYLHSYPHCWRSKTPIIFRAVEQFFIRIADFRTDALNAIDTVNWLPAWGRNRIYGTVESRPDWCISRQRTWGVPLPVFYDTEGQAIMDPDIARKVADAVELHGTNLWFEKDDAFWSDLVGLPEGSKRCKDTLDVWIDSGSSSVAVLDRHPELSCPADVYIEGTDQHRGWFQSSLMVSVAVRGTAPYKTVITNGFVVDTSGKKISKSDQGSDKAAKPMTADHYYNKYGGDMVRLWAASVDYQNDVPFSEELFQQTGESYRRIRNTFRVLLGNLHDEKKSPVNPSEIPSILSKENVEYTLIDRWILERLHTVTTDCLAAYAAYDFRKVVSTITQFVSGDLSALYIDITKDRMYCDAADSPRRRATQAAIREITETLVKLLAPILAYTADETWEFLGHSCSVHLQDFPDASGSSFSVSGSDSTLLVVEDLLKARAVIQQAIEAARQAKQIGSNLEATVHLTLPETGFDHPVFSDLPTLREFFILSDLYLTRGPSLAAKVSSCEHKKCERCWRQTPDVGCDRLHPTLCNRCIGAVKDFTFIQQPTPPLKAPDRVSQLTRIEISNWKSIKTLSLDLDPINILIGPNGAGKSNLVQFFHMLNTMTTGALQNFIAQSGSASSLLHYGDKKSSIESKLIFATEKGTNEYSFNLTWASPNNLFFTRESVIATPSKALGPKPIRDHVFRGGTMETQLDSYQANQKDFLRFTRNRLKGCRYFQFHDTSPESRIRDSGPVDNKWSLYHNAGNLAAVLYRLAQEFPFNYREITSYARSIISSFRDFALDPQNGYLMLDWYDSHKGHRFGPHQISDGSLRSLALFTLLCLPPPMAPEVIVIDEPELGLFPKALEQLSAAIQAAAKNSQIIIATQSSDLVKLIDPPSLIVCTWENGESLIRKVSPVDQIEFMDNYTLGDYLR